MKALFDLEDISDLPDAVKDQLPRWVPGSLKSSFSSQILDLFQFSDRPLCNAEIMVGLYRKFGSAPKAKSLNALLVHLRRKGLLSQESRGFYTITPAGLAILKTVLGEKP